jgi:hypothetical protein
MNDISIIIVNYNNIRFLEACLNSVYNSTHRANFEIIFVDNKSIDNSVELVKSKFPTVRIIENKENLGFGKANNKGLAVYQGRYALLLNTDTIVKESAFDRLLEFMDSHPKAGACGPKLMNTDGTPQQQGGMLSRKFWLASEPVKVDFVIGACLMVRREVIDQVGGLDEGFFFANDDLDWCLRVRKAGWDVYFLPQAEVVHYGGFTTKLFSQRPYVEGFRGGLYFAKKHYGWLVYQAYRLILGLGVTLLFIFSLPLYPLLPNKQKLSAYLKILGICVKGELTPP